jgi:SAM-dependent methyltransferase
VDERRLLDEQISYYRARAGEYDEWFLRQGRYDHGLEQRAQWFREVAEVEAALRAEALRGEILELACGTGLWTRHLVETADRVTAVDASPEVIAVNRARIGSGRVDYVVADIFDWTPARAYHCVVFCFWLSHVPAARFGEFWSLVRRALAPGGKAFFVDNLVRQEATARDQAPLDTGGLVRRKLNDGREFDIVKIFYEPAMLHGRLRQHGWEGYVRGTSTYFIFGCVSPT